MKWLIRVGLLFTVVLMLFFMLYSVPWRYRVDTEIRGIQARIGDRDYAENVSITVRGVYKRFLFKEDIFDGTIAVDKYEFTLNGSDFPFRFYDNSSTLLYVTNIKGSYTHEYLGRVYACTPSFEQLLILVSEPIDSNRNRWTAESGLYISAPAENGYQAIEIARYFSENQDWSINWE